MKFSLALLVCVAAMGMANAASLASQGADAVKTATVVHNKAGASVATAATAAEGVAVEAGEAAAAAEEDEDKDADTALVEEGEEAEEEDEVGQGVGGELGSLQASKVARNVEH